MIDFVFPNNCGNSPKSLAVIDFYKSLFSYDREAVDSVVSDDFVYVIHGLKEYAGQERVHELMQEMKESKMQRLEVENVISHGKYAAAHGKLDLKDGSGLAFSEFFTFSGHSKSAHIARVDSYTVMMLTK